MFLRGVFVPLLFILIESLAIHRYANSTSYTRAKLLAVSNEVVGGVFGRIAGTREYFGLRSRNRELVDEIAGLRNQLAAVGGSYGGDSLRGQFARLQGVVHDFASGTGTKEIAPYVYTTARVINNSTTHQENFFTVDRGERDGIEPDMGVLTPRGEVLGYVVAVSNRFAVCMSILNRNFRTGGRPKDADYIGSIRWEGTSPDFVLLEELQKYADIHRGDTIVTAGFSSFFPPRMTVGTVESYALNSNGTYYEVKVRLATHLSAIREVLLVKNVDAVEINRLETSVYGDRRHQ